MTHNDLIEINQRRALMLANESVVVSDLGSILGGDTSHPREQMKIVVVQHEGARAALLVSDWLGAPEVVVKPLDAFFKNNRLCTGACVLADGSLAMVLNPPEIVSRALGFAPRIQLAIPGELAGNRAERLLLVEDSGITRAMLARILLSMGYEVREAENGRAAVRALDTETIDLLLTDIEMPEMDGIELIKHVRSRSAYQNLPIVVLSTRGTDEDKQLAIDAGADAYVVKTEFSEAVLRDVVQKRLGRA